jgi:membrane protein
MKRITIPGFNNLNTYQLTKFLFKQLNSINLYERASAISFNLLMALPASFLFLFSLIPYFPASFNVKKQILSLFKDIAPDSGTYKFIVTVINDLLSQHVGIFSFGFLLLIFYASNAMMGIIRTFDRSIQEQKGFFMHRRWRAIKLTAILIVLIIASSLILIGQEQLASLVRSLFQLKRKTTLPYWNGVRWSIIIG